MTNDDWIILAQNVRESGDFEEDTSLVEVIESVLRERLDVEEASATPEEVRAKQEELRSKIHGGK
jgi:hypothetical protein